MRHFVYQHVPGFGVGTREPRRPYPTGGLGSGVGTIYQPPIVSVRGATSLISSETASGISSPTIAPSVASGGDREAVVPFQPHTVKSNEPDPNVTSEEPPDAVESWEET